MPENEQSNDCQLARQFFDARIAEDAAPQNLGGKTKEQLENHLSCCADCLIWQKETTELIAVASQLPQYDVPEALTQRILAEVHQEARRPEWTRLAFFYCVGFAAVALLVLKDAFEGPDGIASWALGGAAMFIFAWLVQDRDQSRSEVSEVV